MGYLHQTDPSGASPPRSTSGPSWRSGAHLASAVFVFLIGLTSVSCNQQEQMQVVVDANRALLQEKDRELAAIRARETELQSTVKVLEAKLADTEERLARLEAQGASGNPEQVVQALLPHLQAAIAESLRATLEQVELSGTEEPSGDIRANGAASELRPAGPGVPRFRFEFPGAP